MRRVVLTRIVAGVPLLFGVSLVGFGLIHLAPGSFTDRFLLDPAIPPETLDALLHRYGLDQPWTTQYLSWANGIFRGDLGFSLSFQRPVAELLGETSVYTLTLAASAGVIASLGGLALALVSVFRPGSLMERALSGLALVAVSVPTLVLAVAGLGVAAGTGLVPLGGGSTVGLSHVSCTARIVDFAAHLLLPATILTLALGPLFFLQARGALLEVLPSDFARAARSRGLSPVQVVLGHCLRVALVPFLTFAGSSVGRILSASFLVEVVTGWPGMGRLVWMALLARDPFLVQGVLVLSSAFIVAGNLIADLVIAVADPRVRLEEPL